MPSVNALTDGGPIQPFAMPLQGLHARARALLLSRDVQALLLVVQDDELLFTGPPLDRVDVVHFIDAALVASRTEKPGALPKPRADELVKFLHVWKRN